MLFNLLKYFIVLRDNLVGLYNYFKRKYKKIFISLSKKEGNYSEFLQSKISNILNLNNNCALVALHIAKPEIDEKEIIEAFNECATGWEEPDRNGITNSEFDQSLDYLGLHDITSYVECDSHYTVERFIKEYKNTTCVVLVFGHFLSYTQNCFYDYFGRSELLPHRRILAIWQFQNQTI